MSRRSGPNRRQLLRRAAVLAAAPVVAATAAESAAGQTPSDALAARGAALVEAAKAQYGKHLSEEQFKSLSQSILRSLVTGERLKRQPLRNGDEPAVVFQADLP